MLVIPPALESAAYVALQTAGLPGSPNNDINYLKSKSFTVVVERQDANAATVAVTLVDPRGRRKVAADETVRLDFVREGARWAIDDVRGSVDGHSWSVKEILKSYLSP